MEQVEEYVAMQPKLVEVDLTKVKTVMEYAKMIGKSRQRVYELIREGEIKVLKIAGKNFIVCEQR